LDADKAKQKTKEFKAQTRQKAPEGREDFHGAMAIAGKKSGLEFNA